MIIATAYLPPIWYFEKMISAPAVVIESREHFVKQTIRNRCHILSPNGIQQLVVPVVHQNRNRTSIKEIRIANELPWQRQHWRSLCAAYQRSAFFEFYQDELLPFYERPFEFLFDYNMELMQFLLEQLQLNKSIACTTYYQPPGDLTAGDVRTECNTGLPLVSGAEKSYPQVFNYKGAFVAGLSVVDLLFSMGPASRSYLQSGGQ